MRSFVALHQSESLALIVSFLITSCGVSRAELIFSQDFSSSSSLADYYKSPADPNQFDDISSYGKVTPQIVGGALQFTRASTATSTARGDFTRSTDLPSAPDILIFRFDLQVSGNSSQKGDAARLQIGSGFATGYDPAADSTVHSQLTLGLDRTTGDFGIRDPVTQTDHWFSGKDATGKQVPTSLLWVINNSGAPFQYLDPHNALRTVGNDKWDLWVGGSLPFDEKPGSTTVTALTDFKFFFGSGVGTFQFDNIRIDDGRLPAVPESRWAGLLAVGMALVALAANGRACRASGTSSVGAVRKAEKLKG